MLALLLQEWLASATRELIGFVAICVGIIFGAVILYRLAIGKKIAD